MIYGQVSVESRLFLKEFVNKLFEKKCHFCIKTGENKFVMIMIFGKWSLSGIQCLFMGTVATGSYISYSSILEDFQPGYGKIILKKSVNNFMRTSRLKVFKN